MYCTFTIFKTDSAQNDFQMYVLLSYLQPIYAWPLYVSKKLQLVNKVTL